MDEIQLVSENILDQGSILIQSPPTLHIDEGIYQSAFNACLNPDVEQVIWVCYQHIPTELVKILKENGLDFSKISRKVWFIDMIGDIMGLTETEDNIIFCSNPTDYSCMLRIIDEKIDKIGKSLIIIDSLNGISSYDQAERFIKIIRNLNNKVSTKKCTALYLNIKGAFDPQTEIAIMASMHKVLDLSNTEPEKSEGNGLKGLKNVTWKDVFSLNSPLLFIILLVILIVNITLITLIVYLILK